jgi:carbonic anhydrase/acetyltransferase-like protein (isoleucine patch superfamily)
VHVEDFVMIGAGSVVTQGKRLASGGLYVGNPARRQRELTTREVEFLTYSAQNYVRLKDEYLHAASQG